MRVSTVAIAIVLAAALASSAGPASAARIAVGLKGGLSVSSLHGSLPTDPLEKRVRYGAGGGVSLAIELGPRLSLQPEVLYVTKGASHGKVELTDSTGTVLGTAEIIEAIDYLELPVLVRIALPGRGSFDPFVVAGPSLGIRTLQELKLTGDATSSAGIDSFRDADLGFALATGFEMGQGRARGLFEARYTVGLTPAPREPYGARNGALLVMAGLAIRP